jgi:hypothetical protein
VLTYPEGTLKKVLAKLENCWHSLRELLKRFCKLRNVFVLAEGAFKKVLASLDMCWHSQKELLKKC